MGITKGGGLSGVQVGSLNPRAGNWGESEGGGGEGWAAWNSLWRVTQGTNAYLSPTWTRTWINTFANELAPSQVVVRDGANTAIGTCLLTPNTNRSAVLPLRRVFVNTAGERAADSVVIERNAVLCAPTNEQAVYYALGRYLIDSRADELMVTGAYENSIARWKEALPDWRLDVEWRSSPFVGLSELRSSGAQHLDVLSRNTREQVRRSIKKYRERGELTLEVAANASEALLFFDQMLELHKLRWAREGKQGGFATPLRQQFHRAYISAAAESGEAQLVRVRSGHDVIGVLYNLVAGGVVCFYQSGLLYESDKHLKPGLTVHHLAIDYYLGSGLDEYDFLPSGPGEGRYKNSLANSERVLGTALLQRPGWRRRYFDMARSARRSLNKIQTHNGKP